MNVLEAILNAQGGGVAQQLGQQFGLNPQQTSSALGALVPALAAGLQRNASQQDGLGSLIGALTKGGHQRYVDDVSQLGQAATVADGNGILGHILGSKDVSRQLATKAAQQTGLSDALLKQMLPVVASAMMGTLAKQALGAAVGGGKVGATAGAGVLGMLTPLLDRDRDGSVVDDVLGMVGKFMR